MVLAMLCNWEAKWYSQGFGRAIQPASLGSCSSLTLAVVLCQIRDRKIELMIWNSFNWVTIGEL